LNPNTATPEVRTSFWLNRTHYSYLLLNLSEGLQFYTQSSKMAGNDSGKSRGPPPTGLPAPEKLPAELQRIVDKADREENFYDELYDGTYVATAQASPRIRIVYKPLLTALQGP
jgi:hypothetical protein